MSEGQGHETRRGLGRLYKKGGLSTELGNVLGTRALGRTHVHLDLDVLDDALGKVNDYPSPGDLLEPDLISCTELTPKRVTPTSLTVCSFDPHAGDGDKIAKIAVHAISTFMSSLVETGGLLRCVFDSASSSDIQVWIAFV